MIEGLEKLLANGKDGAELRFGLGSGYLAQGDFDRAIVHLCACVALKPNYSAAWKLLGKAYQQADDQQRAIDAYRQGIAVAEAQGDQQAQKEMRVFLRRLGG